MQKTHLWKRFSNFCNNTAGLASICRQQLHADEVVTPRPSLTHLQPGPPHHATPDGRGLSHRQPNKPSTPSRKLVAPRACGASGPWLGMLMGPRGWCSQATWPSAGQSRARQLVAAAAGAPGTEGSPGSRSLLQPGWGAQVVLPLVRGSGSEYRLSFWRRSSTPRPQMRGQIRPTGTNGKEGIALATPLAILTAP